MLILAMGLTLNAESNLGSSPIISIPYTLSFLWPVSFANLTLALYVLFVMLEFILKGKNRRWTDILQIPLSIVFTRFLDLFTAWFDFTDSSFADAAGISRLRHGGACGKLHAQKAPGGLFCADPPGSFLFLPLFSLISAVRRFYLSQSLICSYTPFPSSLYFSSSFTAGPDSQ